MNKKLLGIAITGALSVITAASFAFGGGLSKLIHLVATNGSKWNHYDRRDPTEEQLGIREYWAECGTGIHVFSEPQEGTITDKGTAYDTSEFSENDDRYIPYMIDEYHHDFSVYLYGAHDSDLSKDWYDWDYVETNSTADTLNYKVYEQNTFKLDLPRVDFERYNHVSMKFSSSNYHGRVCLGLSEDDVTYKDGIESDREIDGTIMFVLNGNKLKMGLVFGTISISRTITDTNIISGKQSASVYVKALYDRFFSISKITFDTSNFVVPTYTFSQGAYGTGIYNISLDKEENYLMSITREGETTTSTQLLYAAYDMNLFRFSLPKVDFELYNSVSMTLYVPAYNSNSLVGLSEDDVTIFSGSGDSSFTGHLSFVYNGEKLIADLDFGTAHATKDVTNAAVISGNASPLLFTKGYYNRQIIVRDFTISPIPEIKLQNDWTKNKLGAFMTKGSGDVTWGFGTYTTSSVLGYKSWDVDNFEWGLPRINYSIFTKVKMDMTLTVWHNCMAFGLSSDDVTHYYTEGADNNGNINNAPAEFLMVYDGTKLTVTFSVGNVSIQRDILDSSIINGNASVSFYHQSKYDRHADLTNITLGFLESTTSVTQSKIRNSLWCGSYHFQDTSVLEAVADAGFDVLISVNPVWHTNFNNILDTAESLGISFIVDPREYNSGVGGYVDWDGTCPSYASHPAVLGFILYDEPSTLKFSSLADMQETFKSVMPEDKLFFVNLLSCSNGLSSLYGSETNKPADYESLYAEEYASTCSDADLYAFDSYYLFTNGQTRKSFLCNFDIWSNLGKNNNRDVWYTMLSAGHTAGDQGGEHRYITPTDKELRWQASVGLTYGMSELAHYTFTTTDADDECMAILNGGQVNTNTDLFNDVSKVNHELKELDKTYRNYIWKGVSTVHTGSKINLLFQNLQHSIDVTSYGINSVTTSNSDLIIGSFTEKDSYDKAFMITNVGGSDDYTSTMPMSKRRRHTRLSDLPGFS